MRALLLLITLLGVAAVKEPPQTILESLPATLAGCSRGEYHAYEETGLGGSVAYRKSGLLVTVYAYDLGKDEIADGVEDETVRKAFEDANAELLMAKQAGYYTKVERRKDGMKKEPPDALVSRYVIIRAKGPDSGLELFSEIHVFGARGHVIKFRISGNQTEEPQSRKILHELLPSLHKALEKPVK